MSSHTVRRYYSRDRDELLALAAYAADGSPTESLWGDPVSEAAVYLMPYLDQEPESTFVAELDGALVGYIVGSLGRGAVGQGAVASEDDRLIRAITEHRVYLRPRALPFFARSARDGLVTALRREPRAGEIDDARWPAHLHINVAAPARGTGLADGLMAAFQTHVRDVGVAGAYLQTLVENERAVRFFGRMGFRAYGETPRVPGLRYRGARVRQQTMVWSARE
jgi:ribosomal protein S18 acetylase RimI-like enzyme